MGEGNPKGLRFVVNVRGQILLIAPAPHGAKIQGKGINFSSTKFRTQTPMHLDVEGQRIGRHAPHLKIWLET